jgi:hypothetical protein
MGIRELPLCQNGAQFLLLNGNLYTGTCRLLSEFFRDVKEKLSWIFCFALFLDAIASLLLPNGC